MEKSLYDEMISITPKYETWGDNVLWAYANLQMIGATLSANESSFSRLSYMVRSKAYKAYKENRWEIHDMYELNKEKIKNNNICWYCRKQVLAPELTADHVFPRVSGGNNYMENIIYVCKTCNSSKGKKDLMEWLLSHGYIPEYLTLEQYIKEIYFDSCAKDIMKLSWETVKNISLPYRYESILLFQNSAFLKKVLQGLSINKVS